MVVSPRLFSNQLGQSKNGLITFLKRLYSCKVRLFFPCINNSSRVASVLRKISAALVNLYPMTKAS